MFRRFLFLFACLAFATATPARAAWTPLLPGWSVHEVPLGIGFVYLDFGLASASMDPLTGDLFVLGSVTPNPSSVSLLRITQAGQVSDFGVVASPAGHPVFDAVHRVVLVPQGVVNEIARFAENGAPLAPIPAPPSGPIAAGPDGGIYSLSAGGPSPTGLQILRYDEGLQSWLLVRNVPAPSVPYPPLDTSDLYQSQFLIDAAGRPFTAHGGVLFRIDDAASVCIGTALISTQMSVMPGMAFFGGPGFFDPDAAMALPGQGFAQPPTGHWMNGLATSPDGPVVFIDVAQNADQSSSFALEIFTQAPTPAVQRSWGAIKALAR